MKLACVDHKILLSVLFIFSIYTYFGLLLSVSFVLNYPGMCFTIILCSFLEALWIDFFREADHYHGDIIF